MYQANPPRPPSEILPTMYDLKSEDPEEPGLPDEFHGLQPNLLSDTFQPLTYPPEQVVVAADLNLYYDPRHTLWYKRPDWFAVLDVARATQQQDLRWSYVIWQEGVAPFLVVELLSPGTEQDDLGQALRELNKPPTKWEVYERILRVPYYAIFDRYTNNFRAFNLVGNRYQEIDLSDQQLWLEEVQLYLGRWQGEYKGVRGVWLRFYDPQGNLVPLPAEAAQQQAEQERQQREAAQQEAEQERQRANQAEARVQQLLAQMRSLGISPNQNNE